MCSAGGLETDNCKEIKDDEDEVGNLDDIPLQGSIGDMDGTQ